MTRQSGKGPGEPGPSRAILLPAVPTGGKFDPDRLPVWTHDPATGYQHGDVKQTAFAFACLDFGFHLPEFDQWLSRRPSSDNKAGFLAARDKAYRAFLADDDEAMALHLSVMDARQIACAVWPDARTGQRAKRNNRDRAKNPRRPAEITAAIKKLASRPGTAKELWPAFGQLLEAEGCIVSETQTAAAEPAIEISHETWEKQFSLKAFGNALSQERKSR